jgi:hypothetical protein
MICQICLEDLEPELIIDGICVECIQIFTPDEIICSDYEASATCESTDNLEE